MIPSRKEALESLNEIQSAGSQARRMAEGETAPALMWTWGGVMLVGYIATYALVRAEAFRYINPMWGILVALGSAATVWICLNHPLQSPHFRQIAWLWGLVAVYATLWGYFLRGIDSYAFNAFFMTMIMFAWALTGLISGGMVWVWLALSISALIGGGYCLLAPSPVFWLWMSGATGGVTLITGTLAAFGKTRHG